MDYISELTAIKNHAVDSGDWPLARRVHRCILVQKAEEARRDRIAARRKAALARPRERREQLEAQS